MTRLIRFVSPNYEDLTQVHIDQLPPGSAEWIPLEVLSFGPYPWDVYQATTVDFPAGTEIRASIGFASNPHMSDWSEPIILVPEPAAATMLFVGALLLSLLTQRRNHHARAHC